MTQEKPRSPFAPTLAPLPEGCVVVAPDRSNLVRDLAEIGVEVIEKERLDRWDSFSLTYVRWGSKISTGINSVTQHGAILAAGFELLRHLATWDKLDEVAQLATVMHRHPIDPGWPHNRPLAVLIPDWVQDLESRLADVARLWRLAQMIFTEATLLPKRDPAFPWEVRLGGPAAGRGRRSTAPLVRCDETEPAMALVRAVLAQVQSIDEEEPDRIVIEALAKKISANVSDLKPQDNQCNLLHGSLRAYVMAVPTSIQGDWVFEASFGMASFPSLSAKKITGQGSTRSAAICDLHDRVLAFFAEHAAALKEASLSS